MSLTDDPADTRRAPCLKTLLRRRSFERTPDGHLQVWQLYRPEPWTTDGVWLRKCDTFTSEDSAKGFLNELLGVPVGMSLPWRQHPLFPELQTATDGRGHRWFLEPAPLDPPGGRMPSRSFDAGRTKTDGIQETHVEHRADATVRCAVCGAPMLPADPREQHVHDPRVAHPRRESKPL